VIPVSSDRRRERNVRPAHRAANVVAGAVTFPPARGAVFCPRGDTPRREASDRPDVTVSTTCSHVTPAERDDGRDRD
jgi:hypothetical protein